MKCPRCQGIMGEQRIITPEGSFMAFVCIVCGECVDPVIEANRQACYEAIIASKKQPKSNGMRWIPRGN